MTTGDQRRAWVLTRLLCEELSVREVATFRDRSDWTSDVRRAGTGASARMKGGRSATSGTRGFVFHVKRPPNTPDGGVSSDRSVPRRILRPPPTAEARWLPDWALRPVRAPAPACSCPALVRLRLDMPPLKAGRCPLEARRRRFHVERRPQDLARRGCDPQRHLPRVQPHVRRRCVAAKACPPPSGWGVRRGRNGRLDA
jgi:hypothetical protein